MILSVLLVYSGYHNRDDNYDTFKGKRTKQKQNAGQQNPTTLWSHV